MINSKLALFFAVVFMLGVLVVGTTIIVQDGNKRVKQNDALERGSQVTILGPYGEASTAGQTITGVPMHLMEQWLSACKDRIVTISPVMCNVDSHSYISGYVVVTEKVAK